ncbi:MAG: hypothetical protein H7281_02635 [Bacteriovorax sp.]|nr:hypothetical protein [Bacteriovorax sp.]
MKFSKQLIFVLTFMLALLSQFSLVIAGEIPGYVGQQSFRLQDDPQLNDLSRRADDAKVEVARVDQIKAQLADQIRGLTQQRDSIIGHMNDLQQRIDGAKATKISLQAKLAELNKTPEVNKDQITDIQNKIVEQDNLVADLSRQFGASKLDLGPVNVRLDQIQHDYSTANQNSQIAMGRLQTIARDRENYRQDLINAIQNINNQGARTGLNDGTNDGASMARRLGQDIGSRDGQGDGFNQGTADGQSRDYRRGQDFGDRDGSARAKSDGLRDGTNEGTISGNQNAADREGEVAGIKRGDASNAAAVGIDQGIKAGKERAVKTGSIDGNNKGENETVQKYESGALNSVNINGPFAGSFARRSPSYPGDFNGPNFNPNVYNNRDVLKKAYSDGYLDQYRQYSRYEYLRRIDGEYNAVYDSNYASTYDQANNRQYPEFYERGRKDGDARAYSRDYPVAKTAAFQVAFDQYDASPNRTSIEYKTTYKSSELDAFNNRYEQIRRVNFDRLEIETFNANIGAQTEIYRQKRIGEVTTVYNNNAVLAFVSSEMFDGGINGIAKLDGVFQPGEATLHSITLSNFGAVAAKNVSVLLDNGSAVLLVEIPARSLVTIKGAGLSKISASAAIGSTAKTSLKVLSKLTSDDAVEAQHFDSIGGGVLKSADQKAARVAYPLALSGLSLNSLLLKGVANKLSVSVANNSLRPYAGDMKVQVNVNSQSALITKEFGVLSTLQTNAQLSDAEVLVSNDSDIYRDLSFSATISQNGVTLGVLSSDMVAMAKAQFHDIGKDAVIVANSDKNLDSLLDALSLAGGTEKVSVLDLSLATLNAGILSNGLSGKVLLIVDDENGTNIKSLNSFIGKSKSSSFVFIDESNTGLKNALALGSSKDAQKLLWDKRVVMFTNPHRAEGVQKSSAMIQSSLKSFDKDLALAGELTQTAPELLARLKTEINRSTFFTPSNSIKMFSLKAMAEVLCINIAYDKSGSIFNRDKKWPEMIANDGTLFINVLKSASSGDVTEAKLSAVLPAIALKDTVSNAMSNAEGVSRAMMLKITNATNKVLGNMEDDFKKSLKNFNKDLYNKAYEQASIHRPFYIEPARNPNQ